MKKRSFKIIGVIFLALIAVNSCKKEDLVQNESGLVKQQKSTNFVIVTEEERQYMSEPIDANEFMEAVPEFINLATVEMGCYFVVYVNDDGTVSNAVIGANTSHQEWYNRLSKYFEIAEGYPTIDPPMINPDDPPYEPPFLDEGCISTRDIRILVAKIYELVKAKKNFTASYKDGIFTICWDD